ncbi:hypothetical protein [Peribacillus frigoritolerans]|uniref:hypothetical protein n=1 Tax=Peribacillus frigoritolerans TaxID=450367 RepID=UPI00105A7755|nr:hypothetical protein [Peribacillus frigoritolerans]TDL82834.1 hypothetical protein E2R53_04540 [Peribacillus frigoritolerans]
MVKCLTALVLMISLVFTPVGDSVMEKNTSYVSAKSFKGGKRRYNPNSNYNQPDAPRSNFRNRRTNPARGGIMRGLLYGGIAGLLLGSMLGHLGFLGGILGLLINLFAIFLFILVIRKVIRFFFTRVN